MNRIFGINSTLGQVFSCLLLAVFVFLGLIPTGFMPDFANKNGTYITICSGLDSREIKVDDEGNPIPSYMPPGEICIFSASPPVTLDVAYTQIQQPKLNTFSNAQALPPIQRTQNAFSNAQARAPPVA